MKKRAIFSLSGRLLMILFGIAILNLCLIFFVAALDILLGQPPQLTVPLFALLFSVGGIWLNRPARIEARREGRISRQALSGAPAYLSMTVIRRPLATVQPTVADNWEEVIQ